MISENPVVDFGSRLDMCTLSFAVFLSTTSNKWQWSASVISTLFVMMSHLSTTSTTISTSHTSFLTCFINISCAVFSHNNNRIICTAFKHTCIKFKIYHLCFIKRKYCYCMISVFVIKNRKRFQLDIR